MNSPWLKAETWSWLDAQAVGVILFGSAIVIVPIVIYCAIQRRAQRQRLARLATTAICQSCGVETPRLGFLDFFAFEGWFIIAWLQVHYSSIVCESCAQQAVEHSRRRARKTWWKSFPLGHFIVLLTFINSRAALKEHAKSMEEKAANQAVHAIGASAPQHDG